MHRPPLPRLLPALGLAAMLALLSGCSNPCNYSVDTWDTQRKPVQTSTDTPGESPRQLTEAQMTPEQRAAREKFISEVREAAARDKARGTGARVPNPMQRIQPATITDCAERYGYGAFTWLLGVLVILAGAHFVSKRLTGRSLASWFQQGKKR